MLCTWARRKAGPLYFTVLLCAILAPVVQAQEDERRVSSPDGQIELRVFVAQPAGSIWSRVGYQVYLHGKPLITTSFLGLDIWNQEPMLGENVGLMKSTAASNNRYRSLVAEYGQNGSLGRRLNIEVRVYNNGLAFRYVLPMSTPLEEILIHDEATEFHFAEVGVLDRLEPLPDYDLPFAVHEVAIMDSGGAGYPRTFLINPGGSNMVTNLARKPDDPNIAYSGKTPLTWPWRVLVIGPEAEHPAQAGILRELQQ